MRWGSGLISLGLAVLLWVGSLLADPYTSWGVEHEQVRPGVAHISTYFAVAALVLLLVSALVVFWDKANRGGGKAIAFTITLLFFVGSALARLVWIEFYVLV